ncbi:MAG TPA: PEP/pyruvate-binding domain-containing protein [Pyrinomonadaceae bacterium]|jgi:pyruvate,water dikinase
MEPNILSFDSPLADLATVGGKGANLARLTRAGFAVPPGFFVTTAAYHQFVSANGIKARLLKLARSVTPGDATALDAVAEEIRALFASGHLPREVSDAIISAYAALSATVEGESARASLLSHGLMVAAPVAVAVRSSATAEDLPDLSFAGQQETYLNVTGARAVCDGVKACWGSLWTARALGYRARHKVPEEELALAVVVQQMVSSESSGVLFTANPLTGSRHETVIDACLGLGEAVVAGQVEPDHYVVDTRQWQIASVKLGAKGTVILPRPGGGTQSVQQNNGARQALPDEQILALANLGSRVAEAFGTPQDIEWAWANRQLCLLQARPITALYPLPPRSRDGDDLRVYLNFSAIQGMMEPMTTLGAAVSKMFARGLSLGDPERFLSCIGGRLFIDITALALNPRLRRLLLQGLSRVDPASRRTLLRLSSEGRLCDGPTSSAQGPEAEPSSKALRKRVAILKAPFRARRLLWRALAALLRPEGARWRAHTRAEAFMERVGRHAQEASTLSAALAALEADLRDTPSRLFAQILPAIVPAMLIMSKVDGWLVEWLGLKAGAGLQLMRGLPGNVTTEMDLKLWSLAQTIRAEAEVRRRLLAAPVAETAEAYRQGMLPPKIQRALKAFFDEYGLRGIAEIDIGRARWREDPSFILHTLYSYLQLEDASMAPDIAFERGAAEAARLRAEYVARVRRMKFGFVRAKLLNGAIRRMRLLGALRELPKSYLSKILGTYRALLLEHGRSLVQNSVLDSPEEIFFVPFDELKRFAEGAPVDLKAIVCEERAAYEREMARKQVPRLLLSTGETFYEGIAEADASDLTGDAVSPGLAEGSVRVVLNPQGVRLDAGEILVCPSTDPGWTPLFLMAGGLVMEMGGLVTHGSVVAREYGIPAVVGVHQATQRLKTGQRVRIDGSAGRITVLN